MCLVRRCSQKKSSWCCLYFRYVLYSISIKLESILIVNFALSCFLPILAKNDCYICFFKNFDVLYDLIFEKLRIDYPFRPQGSIIKCIDEAIPLHQRSQSGLCHRPNLV